MAYVWRVETKNGEGVYSCDAANYALSSTDDGDSDRHPIPQFDPSLADWWDTVPLDVTERFFFGFTTLAQYRAWFSTRESRKRLAEHSSGVRLVKYWVHPAHLKRGGCQAVFLRDVAVKMVERACDYI